MPTVFIHPRENTSLRSLGITYIRSNDQSEVEDGNQFQRSGSISPRSLPSPSLLAARAYFSQCKTTIGINNGRQSRHGSCIQVSQVPRRHSVMPVTAEFATSIDATASSISEPRKLRSVTRIKTNEAKETIINTGVKLNGISPISTVPATQHLGTASQGGFIHRVPFQYTHDRLRTWGIAYLGNTATADVFVNAIGLRRPSLTAIKEENTVESSLSSELTTIRARVVPKSNKGKPFLIQRRFDIQELRNNIPAHRGNHDLSSTSISTRRSSRLRRLSLQHTPVNDQRGRQGDHMLNRKLRLDHVAMPIHIEYALHYLPVLAALMLSGHVRKGDFIDLPLPQPEAWIDTIQYIYTGRGDITSAMKDNILFLAGRV